MARIQIKKITGKTLGVETIGRGYRVIGRVTNMVRGTSQYGDFTKFGGSFEAVVFTNAETGEVGDDTYAASTLIVPSVVENQIAAEFAALIETVPGASLEIGYDVRLVANKTPIGREWQASQVVESRPEADPLAHVRSLLAGPKGADKASQAPLPAPAPRQLLSPRRAASKKK